MPNIGSETDGLSARRSTLAIALMITPSHYIAIPKAGKGPGVLVLHSWWELNTFFKDLCERFADAGFVALAPDLYADKVASTVAATRKLQTQATA